MGSESYFPYHNSEQIEKYRNPMKPQQVPQKLKKHRRIKSQQPFRCQSISHNSADPISPIRSSNSLTFHIELTDQSNKQQNIKMNIESKESMKDLKQKLCSKIGVKADQVYFWTFDHDYNFQYRLEEQIGVADVGKRLGVSNVTAVKTQNGHYEEGHLISDFLVFDCLSVGGFSKVFLIRSKKSGKFYAAKFINKNYDNSDKFKDLIMNQKYINQLLDYKLLVKMHRFIETKQFYIFIMDYCPAGELFCLMKNHRDMNQAQARFYFIESVLAIQYMHNRSIIYRDIKPENILLDKNGHIKIADFGLAKIMRERSKSYCGSLEYMAPQIVLGAEHSFGVDHYCLGSLLFQMMVGCPPFYNPNFTPSQTKYHIVNSAVKFPSAKNFSSELIDLITKLLDKNPKTRLGSLGGIKEILLHPWIGKFDRKKFESQQIQPPFKIDLSKSNFETAYLPLEDIEQVKRKINEQLEQKVNIKTLKNKERRSSKNISLQSLDEKRMKMSNAINKCFQYSPSAKKKHKNPYEMMIFKVENSDKKLSLSNQKVKFKSESKSSHGQTNWSTLTKDRSLTKNWKQQPQRSSASDLKHVFAQNKLKRESIDKRCRNKVNGQISSKLVRKSGNFQKQNMYKQKFLMKSKEANKKMEGYLRNSLISEKELQQKMGNKGSSHINRILVNAVY